MINKTQPLVSIITPSYNSEEFIAETINSIICQTYPNWELIIIDDASIDKTIDILHEFANKDSRIKYLRNEKNSGAAITRNKGLDNAQGRFIAFIDSDDIWSKSKLEKQVNFMIDNNIPISFTSYSLINEKSVSLNKTIRSVPSIDYNGYLKNTIIGMSTAMIDTNIVSKDFRFVNIRTRQDTYLWITLLKKGHTAFGIDEILASYRVRKSSISANKFKAAKRVWYLYYNLEKLGLLKSAYNFSYYIFNALKKRT
ncbi:teichuronic acid biosynthesis glycosyltransferase TuaG [Maribacter vaceletii]|uniref:Teichuronic acid biosynthesis glycosyltransferase TuaG n=1 Tax=Maribacter vaceletii TaxID=1206816 RepID=A0A495DSM9_9FLAO|nr:glycosyltransferase family 2 protein [Maribacter vaceletii]RKR07169.1 teichuronic acid biosynthesis glycosyltransferase TuaG [Maribacter vaceletii]